MRLLDFLFGHSQYSVSPESIEVSKSRTNSEIEADSKAPPKIFIELTNYDGSRIGRSTRKPSTRPAAWSNTSNYGDSSYEIREKIQLSLVPPLKKGEQTKPPIKTFKIIKTNKTVLPKSTAGSKSPMNPAKSMMIRNNSRRKLLCILALVIFIVFGTAIGVTCYYILHELDNLPDLTKLCQKAQTSIGNEQFRSCFYHSKPYPTNCKRSNCDTVLLKADSIKMSSIDSIIVSFNESSSDKINHLNSIPDYTPCDNDKWCVDGECVHTNDARVKSYWSDFASITIDGHWRTSCNEFKCIDTSGLDRIKLKTDCYNKECSSSHVQLRDTLSFQIGYRSCDDPKPTNDGQKCWSNESIIPLNVIKICNYCNVKKDLWDNLPFENCVHYDFAHTCLFSCDNGKNTNYTPQGYPCRVNNGTKGVCFYGMCVPIGDKCQT